VPPGFKSRLAPETTDVKRAVGLTT
jgi:hypothetical protein